MISLIPVFFSAVFPMEEARSLISAHSPSDLVRRKVHQLSVSYFPARRPGRFTEQLARKELTRIPAGLSADGDFSYPCSFMIGRGLTIVQGIDITDLWVHGSGNLIQTLLANHLVHTMHIWTFPVLVGTGKRLFAEGTRAEGLKLVDCKIADTGVIISSYERAGDLKVGSFALENLPAEKRV